MDKMPLISIIFYSIPEAYLLFIFGLIILGQKIKLSRIIIAVILFVMFSYVTRGLPMPFGFHTIFGITAIAVIFRLILGLDLKKALIATFTSSGTLIALENVVLFILQLELNMSAEEIWRYPILRTVIGWPHLFIWSLITWLFYKKKITLAKGI